jgi:hypothetical protein
LIAVTVLTDDDPTPTAGPATSASATPTDSPAADPTDEPTDDPTVDSSPSEPPAAETSIQPVYYVGDTPAGTRLYREFRVLPAHHEAGPEIQESIGQAVGGTPLDPDYRSDWPAGTTVNSVSVAGTGDQDVITVDLSNPAGLHDRPAGMSQEDAEMAIQQLIYTAQGVIQARQPVQLLLDGQHTDTVLGVPASEPLAEGDATRVQASVWIIDPQENSPEGNPVGTTFVVDGVGSFFEANVSWQLLQDGDVVKEGHATSEEGMTRSWYRFKVTAEPGDYVLRVYDADMSGGEGNGEAEDTKNITVQ